VQEHLVEVFLQQPRDLGPAKVVDPDVHLCLPLRPG
jgi:hypothetical protein